MSVIVATSENGVVYMGADTQTTVSINRVNRLCEASHKIVRLENGMLVGFCGRVAVKQTLLSLEDVFVLDERGELNKKHIVETILPTLTSKKESIGDENGNMCVSILLAHKDKLYKITSEFEVVRLTKFARLGAGSNHTNYAMIERTDLAPRERILLALRESAKRTESVSGPYILIDTKALTYEIVDMGGGNH